MPKSALREPYKGELPPKSPEWEVHLVDVQGNTIGVEAFEPELSVELGRRSKGTVIFHDTPEAEVRSALVYFKNNIVATVPVQVIQTVAGGTLNLEIEL